MSSPLPGRERFGCPVLQSIYAPAGAGGEWRGEFCGPDSELRPWEANDFTPRRREQISTELQALGAMDANGIVRPMLFLSVERTSLFARQEDVCVGS